jgi:hypothetical protein
LAEEVNWIKATELHYTMRLHHTMRFFFARRSMKLLVLFACGGVLFAYSANK